MKELRQFTEGLFDVEKSVSKVDKAGDLEDLQKFVKEHEKEFLDQIWKTQPIYKWSSRGIDLSNCRVTWDKVIEWWREGIQIPISKVGFFSMSGGGFNVEKLPKDIKDLKFLVDVIWAKTKIDCVHLESRSNITEDAKLLIYHPNLQGLSFYDVWPSGILTSLDYGKISARSIGIGHSDTGGNYGTSKVMFDYKKIAGMKNLTKLRVDYPYSLLDLSQWQRGEVKTWEVTDEQAEAINYLFKHNPKLKTILVNAMFAYRGSNSRFRGKPYHIKIERSGSSFTARWA